VEMSGFRIPQLPPAIQRFGRCGEEEEVEDARQDGGPRSASSPSTYPYGPSSAAVQLPQHPDRVKSFMNGVMLPFTACFQPTVTSCVSGGATQYAPDFSTTFRKVPAVVTPGATKPSSKTNATRRGSLSNRPHQRDTQLSPTSVGREEQESYHRKAALVSKPGSSSTNAIAELSPSSSAAVSSPVRQTDNIAQPEANDILCGRGGSSNRHSGNINFRELVAANKKTYVTLTKKQKMMLARQIVELITSAGGRFLARESDSSYYYDIGLPRSLEKTSQALREKNSNEMPHEQNGDGIETSVQSFNSVVKGDENDDISESKQIADLSPASGTEKMKPLTSNKSPKNVEPPPLVIPPHLMHVYGPDGKHPDADSTLSPNGPRPTIQYHYGSPYHSPRGSHGGPPTPPDAHHVVPLPHHFHPAYHPSSPPGSYAERCRYYYHHHPHQYPPHGPPYGPYPYPDDHRRHHHHHRHAYYPCPPMDKREAYSEHYSKSAQRERPHRSPIHYVAHPYPQAPRLAQPYHGGHPGPSLPPSCEKTMVVKNGTPVSPPSHRPSPYAGHDLPIRPPGVQPAGYPPPIPSVIPHDGSSSKVFYRTPSNGYVRGNVEVSPERQREGKRQRNVDGHIRRVSESSLSSAVRNSLTLEERIVGKERQTSVVDNQFNSFAKSPGRSTISDLMSPSCVLQSRSRRSMDGKDPRTASLSETKEDYSTLSGLAALSTAAFLKMDEDM
jgi:hypothetical protein